MRISLSLKIEENSDFGEYILSLKDSKSLMPLISSLLKVYYENDILRSEINDVIHKNTHFAGGILEVQQQMANVQRALNQANMDSSMLMNHVENSRSTIQVGSAQGVFAPPVTPVSETKELPNPEQEKRISDLESSLEKVNKDLATVLEILQSGVKVDSTTSAIEVGTTSDDYEIVTHMPPKPEPVVERVVERVVEPVQAPVEEKEVPKTNFVLDNDSDSEDKVDSEPEVFVPKKLAIKPKLIIEDDLDDDEEKEEEEGSNKKPASFNKMFGSLNKK